MRRRIMPSMVNSALIAAVAVANGLPVYTCNADDFDGIDGLHVVPVSVADEVTA